MTRKSMPVILMLIAGGVTCVITFIQKYSVLEKLIALLIVLLVFYMLGSILKMVLDAFEEQNSKIVISTEEEEKVEPKE